MRINRANIHTACAALANRTEPAILRLINDSEYDALSAYYQTPIEDLFYLSIFGLDLVGLDDLFCCPGAKEKGKWILWDKGYPLDRLSDVFHMECSVDEMVNFVTKIVDIVENTCKGEKVS